VTDPGRLAGRVVAPGGAEAKAGAGAGELLSGLVDADFCALEGQGQLLVRDMVAQVGGGGRVQTRVVIVIVVVVVVVIVIVIVWLSPSRWWRGGAASSRVCCGCAPSAGPRRRGMAGAEAASCAWP
jgi:hypothetical protein